MPIDLASIKTENSESSALLENFKFVQSSHKLTEQLKQIKKLKLLLTIKTIRAIIIFVPREQKRTSKSSKKIKKLLTNRTTSDILNELLLRQTTTKNLENQRLNSM